MQQMQQMQQMMWSQMQVMSTAGLSQPRGAMETTASAGSHPLTGVGAAGGGGGGSPALRPSASPMGSPRTSLGASVTGGSDSDAGAATMALFATAACADCAAATVASGGARALCEAHKTPTDFFSPSAVNLVAVWQRGSKTESSCTADWERRGFTAHRQVAHLEARPAANDANSVEPRPLGGGRQHAVSPVDADSALSVAKAVDASVTYLSEAAGSRAGSRSG